MGGRSAINKKGGFAYNIKKYWQLYLMLLPGVAVLAIYKYGPMYGALIAFQDYYPWTGFLESEWVGFKHFENLFSSGVFANLLRNTLTISLTKFAVCFPAPIILALLINEIKNKHFKKTVQTLTYIPNFLSWVIIYGLVYNLFNSSYGTVNEIIKFFGGEAKAFLAEPAYFLPMIVLSALWKGVGYGSIIYLATLSGISPEYYESASIDGANKWHQLIYITLPLITPMIAINLLLTLGSLLNNDFQQIILFINGNPLINQVGDVFETHVYTQGITHLSYSYATAVGLFQSAVGFVLVIFSNIFARKLGYRGIW